MKKSFISITASVVLALASSVAFAVVAEAEPAPVVAQCDLTMATGPQGKGYSKIFDDLKKVVPALPICNKNSEGALDNVGLGLEKKADVFLADAFTFLTMLASDDQLRQFQVVASLHNNYMHTLTLTNGFDVSGPMVAGPQVKNPNYSKFNPLSKDPEFITGPMVAGPATHIDIGKFSDLKSKTVGLVGSAQLIGRKLNDISGHGMQFVDYASDNEAIIAMKKGQVNAVLSMAAWPHGVIDKLKTSDGVKLVPYDLQPTPPFSVVKKSYKGLGQFGVPLLGDPNLLMTRPFAAGGVNAKNVAALRAAIETNLTTLKEGRFEPAWSEVTDLNQTYTLPAFSGKKK